MGNCFLKDKETHGMQHAEIQMLCTRHAGRLCFSQWRTHCISATEEEANRGLDLNYNDTVLNLRAFPWRHRNPFTELVTNPPFARRLKASDTKLIDRACCFPGGEVAESFLTFLGWYFAQNRNKTLEPFADTDSALSFVSYSNGRHRTEHNYNNTFRNFFKCTHHAAHFDLLLIPDCLKWTGTTWNSMVSALSLALDWSLEWIQRFSQLNCCTSVSHLSFL